MVLPTSAIMYASGQSTDNSDDSSTGGSTTSDNNLLTGSTSGWIILLLIIVAHHQLVDLLLLIIVAHHQLVVETATTTTDNSATLPTTSTASDNTGNVLKHGAEDIKAILAVHNRERAASWSSTARVERQARRRRPGLGRSSGYAPSHRSIKRPRPRATIGARRG